MAVVKKNSPFEDLSGRVGDLVFRHRAGKTIVARRPGKRDRSKPTTEPRQGSMSRFKQAVAFARDARHQPAYRSLCRQLRGASPYHLAIQDFLSEPVIESVDAASIGASGGPLLITVREKIAVREVRARPVGGQWIRARVMSVATAKHVTRDESQVPAAATPPRRPSTPAEMFFRKTQGPAAADAHGATPRAGTAQGATAASMAGHAAPAGSVSSRITMAAAAAGAAVAPARGQASLFAQGHAAGLAGQSGGAMVASRQQPSEQATQDEPESKPEEGDERPDQVSSWRVDIPSPGEIEIAAWDYAGNQTIDRWKIGPLAAK